MSGDAFQFAVLRYVHDPVTQEFLNVGVVIYSKEARYLQSLISTRYSRLSDAFQQQINGDHYRRVVNYVQRKISTLASHHFSKQLELIDGLPSRIEDLLYQVLPADDSSFVFGGIGGGLSDDLDEELDNLFERLVNRYVERAERPSRTDTQVWQEYRKAFDEQQVSQHLVSKTIRVSRFSYPFKYAWRNERWHTFEAVSLDLMRERSISNKAHRWIGHSRALATSEEMGSLYLLLGAPKHNGLIGVYQDAVQDLKDFSPSIVKIVEERDIEEFSREIARKIKEHPE